MYEEHPIFIQPVNENVKIWRYMDLTKLISLLSSRQLYFTRADKFDDPYEGSWPKKHDEFRRIIPEAFLYPEEARMSYSKDLDKIIADGKHWKRYIAVNCWHENEYESAAMWKLYLKSNEGIAIQSTYSLLKSSITDAEPVRIGSIKYIDYNLDIIDGTNVFSPFVHKRKSFEHEREIRATIIKFPFSQQPGEYDYSLELIKDGIQINVNLESLIQNIYVSPDASGWFTTLVNDVVKTYGYNFNVNQSEMNSDPLF